MSISVTNNFLLLRKLHFSDLKSRQIVNIAFLAIFSTEPSLARLMVSLILITLV